MPHSGPDTADAVPEIDAIVSFGALNRPVVDREGNGIALAQRNDLGTTLHPWALLGQDELAAGEILPRLGEKDRHLDRECEVAVEILMKAVEVAGDVLQQQGRRARLALIVTLLEEGGVFGRVALVEAHTAVPVVGDAGKARIKRRAEAAEQIGQRISEIPILTLAEAMTGHMDMAAEVTFLRVESGDQPAFFRGQKLLDDRAAEAGKLVGEGFPIVPSGARLRGLNHGGRGDDRRRDVHTTASLLTRARLRSTLQR